MKVEVVLTEADIAQEFAEAIEARDLPEKFFCWFPRSAAEWSKLVQDTELYGGLSETWKQISLTAPEMAQHFGGRIPVISFGAGDGVRDRLLLAALNDAGCEVRLLPGGRQPGHAGIGPWRADDEDIETVGIKAISPAPCT
jgi:hypothetical protein